MDTTVMGGDLVRGHGRTSPGMHHWQVQPRWRLGQSLLAAWAISLRSRFRLAAKKSIG
jgi:hypothetical protein